jgi:hypothetical protein
LAESVTLIVKTNEEAWCRWKENKCVNFEKQASKAVENRVNKGRKMMIVRGGGARISGLGGIMIERKLIGEMNLIENGKKMNEYLKMPKETIDEEGNNVNLAPCETPAFSDYLYPILCDQDPEQGIEEEFKKKSN